MSYTYLDCLWFSLYKGGSTKTKVLQWIKKKHIFLRKYIFVPIICWWVLSFPLNTIFDFSGTSNAVDLFLH